MKVHEDGSEEMHQPDGTVIISRVFWE